MKKALTISLLAVAMVWAGCRSADRVVSEPDEAAAAPRRSYFWDKDLRPVVSAPPQADEPAADTMPVRDMESGRRARRGRTPSEAPTMSPDIVTAYVQQVHPVTTTPGMTTYPYGRPAGVGPGLVAMDETGARGLTIIYPRPDYGILQIDKAMPRQVRLNQPFAYVIKVTNLTEMMITDVILTETLSKEFTFQGSDPVTTVRDNQLVWQIDSLGPKASRSIQISGIATGARQLEHCTAITHTVRDCAVAEVVEPTLQLVKIITPEALLCEAIPVEYVVTNTGTGAAEQVQISDVLPAGMQTADGKDRVVLDVGSLTAGESRRFAVKIRANKIGTFVNKAVATAATSLRAEAQPTSTTVRQPILRITKSGPQRHFLGRSATYEITVLNRGDGPARETIVEDIIPPGVTSIEATAGAQFSASKLIWELGTLEPNASKKVRVSYTPTVEGQVMATASASAYCAETVTDSISTIVTGIAATRLDLVDLEDPVQVGATTTYLITATNRGSAADHDVRITCMLDDRLQYVSSAGATPGSIMGRTVSFAPLATLDPGAKATWRVVVRGARAGDVLFKVTMRTSELGLSVEQTEATHIYQ